MKIEKELKIKAIAYFKENKKRILKKLSVNSFDYRFIEIPIQIDGVVDKLVFDTVSQKFTEFIFTIGVDQGVSFFDENPEAAYYDKVKILKIPIDESFN